MVLAGGFHGMHGVGFGLGFLNFIGTILFFVFIFMLIKFFIRGSRYAGYRGWERGGRGWNRGDWGRGDWGRGDWGKGAPWMREEFWQNRKGGPRAWHGDWHGDRDNDVDDEAISVARERLAKSEITPEQFEAIKQGLKVDMSDTSGRFDKAVHLARVRFAKGEITSEEFEAVKKTLLS